MTLPSHVLSSRAGLEMTSRQRAIGVYYGEQRLLCRLLGAYPAFVDSRDMMLGPRLVSDGYWESWVTLAIARYLRDGMWCVDVGANYGYYTLLMAAGCGPSGRVLACEPHPLLAQVYLPQTLALNGFHDRVTVCGRVIGDLDGHTVDFVTNNHNLATSSLERWAAGDGTSVPVPTATLDRLCADWPRVDVVKIDAEGAEALVWEGMQETLRRHPQVVVVIELHLQRDPEQTMRFLRRLESDGRYPLHTISYTGDIVSTMADTILANPQEHWTLWLRAKN